MEELLYEDIYAELVDYFTDTDEVIRESALKNCVNRAISMTKSRRKYPSDYTDDMIVEDIENNFIGAVKEVAIYNYVTIGAEFESQHTENNTNRTYKSVGSILDEYGVIPLSKIV